MWALQGLVGATGPIVQLYSRDFEKKATELLTAFFVVASLKEVVWCQQTFTPKFRECC
jgi:hypothetical protein